MKIASSHGVLDSPSRPPVALLGSFPPAHGRREGDANLPCRDNFFIPWATKAMVTSWDGRGATISRYGRSDKRRFSPRAAGCLGGTVSEGGGRLSSAPSVGDMRSLESLRQVAESAETVEVIIPHLVGSKTGGICCYSTQSGSTHLPLSPGSEGPPAITHSLHPTRNPFARFVSKARESRPAFFGFFVPPSWLGLKNRPEN